MSRFLTTQFLVSASHIHQQISLPRYLSIVQEENDLFRQIYLISGRQSSMLETVLSSVLTDVLP